MTELVAFALGGLVAHLVMMAWEAVSHLEPVETPQVWPLPRSRDRQILIDLQRRNEQARFEAEIEYSKEAIRLGIDPTTRF